MKINPFLYLLFGLFFVAGCAQEGVCADLSAIVSTDTLNRPLLEDKELLKEMSNKIRNSYKAKTYLDVDPAYQKVIEEQEVFGGKRWIVKYANPEIHDAIIDLFLELRKMTDTPKELEWLVAGGEDETGQEWFMDLCTVAESTFSPRLYDNEMFPIQSTGKLREEYLARVQPSKTLETILKGSLPNNISDETLVASEKGRRLALWPDGAIKLIAKMRETAPEVVNHNKEKIRKFIKTNVILVKQASSMEIRDFDARTTAMNLLASFNAPQDIPLIQQLADQSIVVQNNKVVDDERNPRLIKELAERLCKQVKEGKKKM